MSDNRVNALVEKKNCFFLYQLKALLTGATEKFSVRREAGKQVIEQLQTAVQSNDNATTEQLLLKLREGFRQAGEGRENFLDQFDQVLQPEQRARLVLYLVQRAKDSGKTVEQLIDTLLSQSGEDNQRIFFLYKIINILIFMQ